MTFLELCQKVAFESGTVAGSAQPSTVMNQTGRLRHIVEWVRDAWRAIQNARTDWRWMEADAQFDTLTNIAEYNGESSQVVGPRFAAWLPHRDQVETGFTISRKADGFADEGHLGYVDWPVFRRTWQVGVHSADKPQKFSIDPAGRLVLHPTPDDVYVVRGIYRKGPQELQSNADVPEMPARHHDVIWRSALLYLAAFDENDTQPPLWSLFQVNGMDALVRDQVAMTNDSGFWR